MPDDIIKSAKATKKNRKFGRSGKSPSMCRYRAEHRWIKNKIKRILSHIKRTKFHDQKSVTVYNKLTGHNLRIYQKG